MARRRNPRIEADLGAVAALVDEPVGQVRRLLADLQTTLEAAVHDRDVAVVAQLTKLLVMVGRDYQTLRLGSERALGELAGGRYVEVVGVGMVERSKSGTTHAFDSVALLDRVLDRARVDCETGEVITDPDALLASVKATLTAVAPFTTSTGWRRTALAELGIPFDDLHTSSGGDLVGRVI